MITTENVRRILFFFKMEGNVRIPVVFVEDCWFFLKGIEGRKELLRIFVIEIYGIWRKILCD